MFLDYTKTLTHFFDINIFVWLYCLASTIDTIFLNFSITHFTVDNGGKFKSYVNDILFMKKQKFYFGNRIIFIHSIFILFKIKQKSSISMYVYICSFQCKWIFKRKNLAVSFLTSAKAFKQQKPKKSLKNGYFNRGCLNKYKVLTNYHCSINTERK